MGFYLNKTEITIFKQAKVYSRLKFQRAWFAVLIK